MDLNRFRKATSVGMTASLLASLFTFIAAGTAMAALGSSGGGTIVPGGAASAAFCLTVGEDSAAAADQFVNGNFTVAVQDNAGVDANVFWVPSSVPAVTVVAGVGGATVGFVGDTLSVTLTGTDTTKIDSFSICNLKVDSLAAAAKGAVIFAVTDVTPVGLPEGLVPASGTLTVPIVGGTDTAATVVLDAGSPAFQPTSTACANASAGSASTVTVAAAGVVLVEVVTAIAPTNATTVTKATAFTGSKPIGTAVTQTVCATRFPSPVTVGDAIDVDTPTVSTMQAGVNSQDGSGPGGTGVTTVLLGYFDGLLQDGDTITFTIDTAGVLFSPDSCLVVSTCIVGTNITAASPVLGAGRTTLTFTLDETGGDDAGTEGQISGVLADSLAFDPNYDVALGTPSGTTVDVSVTVSRAGVTVIGSPTTVGVVGFVVAGSTSAPNVLIGQNDQATGMITLTESGAATIGFTTPDGFIKVCLVNTTETWSVGRYFWAVVTAGDLKLNVAGLAATQGKMAIDTSNPECLEIQVYTVSTVASTIEIRDGSATAPAASGAANGPKINVSNSSLPGAVYVDVYADSSDIAKTGQVGDNIVIAVRAYSNTPIVTVSGQPNVTRGGLGQAAGNIIITEGAPNQFAGLFGFLVCPVNPSGAFTSAWAFSSPVGVNAPVVSTNSTVSGLIATFDPTPATAGCLDIDVTDGGLAGLGVITLSNLKIDVLADAPLGNLFARVFDNGGPTPVLLNQIVSPAKIGTGVAGTATTRLGVTQIGAFTTSTKVAKVRKYVTYRFDFGAGAAGSSVQIWGATKTGNDWSAFSVVTTRVANASGVVYYYIRHNSATWRSYRASWAGGGVLTLARQARWR